MIRLATRRSPLALRQAALAAERITERSGEQVDIVPLSSLGDEDQVRPLARFLQPGAFTGRLDQALQDGEADVAVHSLKDVPLRPPENVSRTYVLERADPADRLVAAAGVSAADLAGRRVGTSAPRRQSQLTDHHPDAIAIDVRGSIGTRLGRIADGELDALFVAAAALERGDDPLPPGAVALRLPVDAWPTAPGQGALALQARSGSDAEHLLACIEDPTAATAVRTERALLADLGGGCGTPLGATCLPPMHPEGEDDRWTFHVTHPHSAGPVLHRLTVHDADPEACRRRALQALQHPETPARVSRTQQKRVLLVMDPQSGTPWRTRLAEAGHVATLWWPFRTVDLLAADADLHMQAAKAFSTADWVVVTSARAVPACSRLHQETEDLPRFAAVGPATARALRTAGLPVTLVPPVAEGERLVRLLAARAAKDGARKVLWASGADVTAETAGALDRSGLVITRIPVYKVEATAPPPLPSGPFDAVLLTSRRMVAHARPLLDNCTAARLYAIGRPTAAALAEAGHTATPLPLPTPSSLLQMLQEH